ncbi:MAG TPA: polysaccharide biosynthesis/export family protein [Pirellulales bacterium]|nr:polysaccharide biosynthesis/export family protein [Pirellulales bacterium]
MMSHPLARPLVWALPLVVLLPALSAQEINQRSGNVAITYPRALSPAAPYSIQAVDGSDLSAGEPGWNAARPIAWQKYAQGEYVGHERLSHVDEYRLRAGDVLDFVLRATRRETSHPYRVNTGDQLLIDSFTDEELNEELIVQPDGTITLRLLGSVHVARRSVSQIRDDLERRYQKYYKLPAITVTPIKVNARLEDLRATADDRMGRGGQSRRVTVTPEGTVQLAALGSVPAQGLSLDELKREIDERLADRIEGIELTPVLVTRAGRYVYVLGEVVTPGRYLVTGPTTAMQAIGLAGGWNYGGNLWSAIVLRRGDDWRLLATRLDLRGSLYGHRPAPADEIWLNDSDIVVVPKTGFLATNNFVNLLFTHGAFGVAPYRGAVGFNFAKFSGVLPDLGVPGLAPIVTPVLPLPHP